MKWLLCAALAAIAYGLLRVSRRERGDMRLLDRAGSPREGERFAVCGRVEIDDEPFRSPVRNKPAVLYHFNVHHLEPRARSESSSEVVDFAGYGVMPFRVGGVRIGSFPSLHDFDVKDISTAEARERMQSFLRFASLEHKGRGTIEWMYLPDPAMWDGRTRVTRGFTRGESWPVEKWRFDETVVEPGENVCAVGVWSTARQAMVSAPKHDLWLYRGTKETVRETLATSVGCARVLGFLLMAGAAALAAYFAGAF